MRKIKVVKIEDNKLIFDDGTKLYSYHEQDCCENHYLDFADLNIMDFEGLEFDLTNEKFFNRIEDYGIELKPINGHVVRVPGYGSNNGYYSSEILLVIEKNKTQERYDVTECQDYEPY